MKKVLLSIGVFICGIFNYTYALEGTNNVSSETESMQYLTTEWKYYGEVVALCFDKYYWFDCVDSNAYYEDGVNDRFIELEEEGGYLLKPYTTTVGLEYRYIDGEKQYRMEGDRNNGYVYKKQTYAYFSLNPYSSIKYVIDSNNRPVFRYKSVGSYSHFVDDYGYYYFIKMR